MTNIKINDAYLKSHFKGSEKSYKDIIDRVVRTFKLNEVCSKEELNDVLYSAVFVPASAILLNADEKILKDNSKRDIFSCYMYKLEDDMVSIATGFRNAMLLTSAGGGIGVDFSALSSPEQNDKTNGVIPFMVGYNTAVKCVNQADTKKGNCTIYLDIEHPEIEEFLEIHIHKGDNERRIKNSFTGVKISDDFMERLINEMKKKNYSSKEFLIFDKIARLRYETGRPFIYFSGNVDRGRCETYKDKKVEFSNLCTEILLNTVPDKASVCCLGSFNFPEAMKLAEKGLSSYIIDTALKIMHRIYSISSQVVRSKDTNCQLHYDWSIGIGTFGYADFVDSKDLEFNSPEAMKYLTKFFDELNKKGMKLGFTQVTAIAPTERISRIFDCSQNIELYNDREFVQKDEAGSTVRKITHKKLSTDYKARDKILFTAEIQKYIHQSISLTLYYDTETDINEMVYDLILAYKKGIKTLYYVKVNPLVVSNVRSIKPNVSMNSNSYYQEEYGEAVNCSVKNEAIIEGCGSCSN